MSRVNREGKQFTEKPKNNLGKKDKTKWQKKDGENYWEEKKNEKKGMEEKTYLQSHE